MSGNKKYSITTPNGLLEALESVKDNTDWDSFSNQKILIESIEVKGELIRSIKKCNKMIEKLMGDTITDKEVE